MKNEKPADQNLALRMAYHDENQDHRKRVNDVIKTNKVEFIERPDTFSGEIMDNIE